MTVIEELGKDAHHRLLLEQQRTEVEQLQQQVALVLLLQRGQLLNATPGLGILMGDVVVDALVADDGTRLQRRSQHQPLQRAAAAQSHIDLPRRKRLVGIDDGAVERQSLTLVDGNGPCQAQGVLPERALHLGLNLARLRVQRVAGVLPL